jgi:hypothetical protein
VAPSQFEINYSYAEAVGAADQIQLYKLLTRQIANNMGFTASYLPKPVVGVNGSGMHTNVSVSKGKTNLFWDEKGEEQLSTFGWSFLDRILTSALDLCLVFNSSVNAYRRLDPHFEAPNQIRASAVDRGAMVRVPIGNSRSMRTEVRAVAPDANPYLVLYSIFKTGIDGQISHEKGLREGGKFLPDNIQQATANTSVTITAPYVAPVPHTQPLCLISFLKDKARPARVDNEAKACLDEVALTLQKQPDAKAVVVGEATAKEKAKAAKEEEAAKKHKHLNAADLAAERAVNTKNYLVTEKGIDSARITVETGTADKQGVEDYLVPLGATFGADVTGTTLVNEDAVKVQPRAALAVKHTHKKAAEK